MRTSVVMVSADPPLTGDELAAIAEEFKQMSAYESSIRDSGLRLVAEVERLRAQVERAEALAQHWTSQARSMSVVDGESPRPNDNSEGHYVGVMRSYEVSADDLRAALAWDE